MRLHEISHNEESWELTFIRPDGTIDLDWYKVFRFKFLYLPTITDRIVPCWNLCKEEDEGRVHHYREMFGKIIDDGYSYVETECIRFLERFKE